MLEVEGVMKRLAGRRVLDGVSVSCASGEVCAILGENGAGKSTLLRVVCGTVEPDAGHVAIQGHELRGGGIAARRRLGYVPDATETLPDLLVEELVSLVCALKELPKNEKLQAEISLWRDRLALTPTWGQRFQTLSFGQRKRTCTLMALLGDPWLLILDEPSNGLDPGGVELMVDLIAERQRQGKAVLLASNDLPFLSHLHAKRHRLENGKLSMTVD
jgi:ABC-type multidrug transport system ATPase subunit